MIPIKRALCGILAMLLIVASGCSNRQGELGNKSFNENNKILRSTRSTNQGTHNGIFSTDRKAADGHRITKMSMSRAMADKVAALPEVKTANVLLTDHSAYVAVSLHSLPGRDRLPNNSAADKATRNMALSRTDTSMGVTTAIKDKIASDIQAMDRNVHQVYVSANPDFVGRLNKLAEDTRNGRPIQGFVTELSEMVQRIFPTNAAEPTPMHRRSGGMNTHMGR